MSASSYIDELTRAMTLLGDRPDSLFLGQQVACPGTAMHATFAGVPEDKKIELPVAENLQMGISTGLALEGFLPVSVFPRMNFLLYAMDQLVNHLDRLPLYSDYRPKVIIRTAVGRSTPLDPGPQHQDDFTGTLDNMLKTVHVTRLAIHGQDGPGGTYKSVLEYPNQESWIVVEEGDAY